MKTLKISKVSVIPHNRSGEVINIVAIRNAGKPAIIRSFDQFVTDLKESFLIDNDVDSVYDPEVRDVLADLQGGTVSGEITFHKAGDPYRIEENSAAVTNPNHKLYGKVSVGDEVEAEKDGSRVTDGFLTLKREATAQVIHKSSNSYAKLRIKAEGFMSAMLESVKSNGNAVVTEADFELDEDIAAEVTGEAAAAKK